ncbi:hypothetical protein [Ectobacillus ponti]|uniref:Uncharacterized protein n=1 Tax=Ectobacillus ponti TaxID=2961894 RepID=A0AA41XAH7_9BACI|nr:hypothetical protein [Ectobacillus ponti]MCP8969739.1 hypothetical protein [Ectobacillus ponti]
MEIFKAYSAHNLLSLELADPADWKGALEKWSRTSSPTVSLKLNVPARYFLKGRDLCKVIQEEYDRKFTLDKLIEFFIREFTEQYAFRDQDPAKYYLKCAELYKDIHTNHFYSEECKEPMKTFRARILRQHIYDMEMLLADIHECNPQEVRQLEGKKVSASLPAIRDDRYFFTVEDVISRRFTLYFNRTIRGFNPYAVKNLIKALKNDEALDDIEEEAYTR